MISKGATMKLSYVWYFSRRESSSWWAFPMWSRCIFFVVPGVRLLIAHNEFCHVVLDVICTACTALMIMLSFSHHNRLHIYCCCIVVVVAHQSSPYSGPSLQDMLNVLEERGKNVPITRRKRMLKSTNINSTTAVVRVGSSWFSQHAPAAFFTWNRSCSYNTWSTSRFQF